MSAGYLESARLKAVAFLHLYGVDPSEVLVTGVTLEGYERLITREDGTIDFYDGDTPATETVAWPEGFPAEEFIALLHEYVGADL